MPPVPCLPYLDRVNCFTSPRKDSEIGIECPLTFKI